MKPLHEFRFVEGHPNEFAVYDKAVSTMPCEVAWVVDGEKRLGLDTIYRF